MSYRALIDAFLCMGTDSVLATFEELPGARSAKKWVYVPGTLPPEQRVLIVAHADTVSSAPPEAIDWNGNIATLGWDSTPWWKQTGADNRAWSSKRRASCLGADDRAGIAIAWAFRNSGHSLLITDEEERGCLGAEAASSVLDRELSEHLFALQVDRRGDCNYVTYDCETPEFCDFLTATLGGTWRKERGTFSDIAVICPTAGLCGINLAAGYLNEHTERETFFLDAWQRTQGAVQKLLNAAQSGDHARFTYEEPVYAGARGTSFAAALTAYVESSGYTDKDDDDNDDPAKESLSLAYEDLPCCPLCGYNDDVDLIMEDYKERGCLFWCDNCTQTFDESDVMDFAREWDEVNEAALAQIDDIVVPTEA